MSQSNELYNQIIRVLQSTDYRDTLDFYGGQRDDAEDGTYVEVSDGQNRVKIKRDPEGKSWRVSDTGRLDLPVVKEVEGGFLIEDSEGPETAYQAARQLVSDAKTVLQHL